MNTVIGQLRDGEWSERRWKEVSPIILSGDFTEEESRLIEVWLASCWDKSFENVLHLLPKKPPAHYLVTVGLVSNVVKHAIRQGRMTEAQSQRLVLLICRTYAKKDTVLPDDLLKELEKVQPELVAYMYGEKQEPPVVQGESPEEIRKLRKEFSKRFPSQCDPTGPVFADVTPKK